MNKNKDQINVILVWADEDECYNQLDRYVKGFKNVKEALKLPNLCLDEEQSTIVDTDGNSIRFLTAVMEHEPDKQLLDAVYRYNCGVSNVDFFEVFKLFGLQKADFDRKTILICSYCKDTVPAKNLKRLVRYAQIATPVILLDKNELGGYDENDLALYQACREPKLTYKSKYEGNILSSEGLDFEEAAKVIWGSDLWRPEQLELAPIFRAVSTLLSITCEKKS